MAYCYGYYSILQTSPTAEFYQLLFQWSLVKIITQNFDFQIPMFHCIIFISHHLHKLLELLNLCTKYTGIAIGLQE